MSSSINHIFKPSPGHILVRPLRKSSESVGGVTFAVNDSFLPLGEVLAVGKPPGHVRVLKVKDGDTVCFSSSMATEIEVLVGGEMEVCRVLSYAELRGVFKNENGDSFLDRAKKLLRRWLSPFGFFLAGLAVGGGIGAFVAMVSCAVRRKRNVDGGGAAGGTGTADNGV